MPFALLFFGILFVVAGVRGTHKDTGSTPGLYSLLKGDLWGKGSFTFWIVAIIAIGALGYIEPMKTPSRYMLALVLIVLVLAQEKAGSGGFFAKFLAGLNAATTAPAVNPPSLVGLPQIPKLPAQQQSPAKPFATIGEMENYFNGVSP